MNFTKTVSKSLRDILSPMIFGFILKIGVGAILFWLLALSLFWKPLKDFVAFYMNLIPLIGNWEWFQATGALLAALALAYMLIIATISILTSLFSEKILIRLAKKEYGIDPVGTPAFHRSLYKTFKASLTFLLLFLVTMPLIFVPIIGQLWMLWLWSILLHEPTIYDVGTLFISDHAKIKYLASKARLVTLTAALFNYIPILNIFAPLFAQILFLHYILGERP